MHATEVVAFGLVLLLASCQGVGPSNPSAPLLPSAKPVPDVDPAAGRPPRISILPERKIPAGKPEPVLSPDEVLRFWVPDHVDGRGAWIGGHYIAVVVREHEWFFQRQARVPIKTDGTSALEQADQLRKVLFKSELNGFVVPFEERVAR
jgi:hypothetical protein